MPLPNKRYFRDRARKLYADPMLDWTDDKIIESDGVFANIIQDFCIHSENGQVSSVDHGIYWMLLLGEVGKDFE